MNNYYTPSGKFSPLSLALFIVLCLTIFPLLGGLYTYAIWYIPFLYINFFITAAFAFSVGFLMNILVIRIGKVRNLKLAIALAAFGALVAIYAHWVVWADLILNSTDTVGSGRISIVSSSTNVDQLLFIAQSPKMLLDLMLAISEFGTWAIFGFEVKGVLLWIIWTLESLIVLIGSILIGIQSAKNPFCERSNKWFNETDLQPISFIFSKPDLVQELEQGSDKILSTLRLHDIVRDNTSYSKFTVFSSDFDEYYLSVVNMKKMVDTNGEVKYEEDEVIQYIEISSRTLSLLESVPVKEKVSKEED